MSSIEASVKQQSHIKEQFVQGALSGSLSREAAYRLLLSYGERYPWLPEVYMSCYKPETVVLIPCSADGDFHKYAKGMLNELNPAFTATVKRACRTIDVRSQLVGIRMDTWLTESIALSVPIHKASKHTSDSQSVLGQIIDDLQRVVSVKTEIFAPKGVKDSRCKIIEVEELLGILYPEEVS